MDTNKKLMKIRADHGKPFIVWEMDVFTKQIAQIFQDCLNYLFLKKYAYKSASKGLAQMINHKETDNI